ncbi:Bug family tripartite tricarboxylate transporter substrate binding protein [Variovorax sp. LjRoot178]|uniref:Bug family tripartite tricarboxylate transporter substrate binding protein n=1 Tax=Variovorax sp. LjRoot178 TaxID=3342277 RepID=UPI003ECF1492
MAALIDRLRIMVPLAWLLFAACAQAADCPQPSCFTGPVKVVVPFAAGSSNDVTARAWADRLSKNIDKPVIVENVTGAAGGPALKMVADSRPDSQTILVTSQSPITIAPNVTRFPVDPSKQLVPAALIAMNPQVLIVRAASEFKTVVELVRSLQAPPTPAHYGSSGRGSFSHLLGEQFALSAGIKANHVPYRGHNAAIADLTAGVLVFMVIDLNLLLPDINAGKVRALAVTGERRTSLAPQVPTFAESGYKDMTSSGWIGAFFPAGTHAAIVSRLNTENTRILANVEVQRQIITAGMEPGALGVSAFTALANADSARWATLARRANIRAE